MDPTQQVASIPVTGFVNGLQLGASGRLLVAAVGQEHRLGRWSRVKAAKNGLLVVRMEPSLPAQRGKLRAAGVEEDDQEDQDDL